MYILLDVFIYTDVNEGKEEAALRCCKTEHYYPSSPLPRTLRRQGNRLEEDAIAKTKNPGNYGQGPLTPTLPPFNLRRDLSPDSWFSTSISRSNASIERHLSLFLFRYSRVSSLSQILISLFFLSITPIIRFVCYIRDSMNRIFFNVYIYLGKRVGNDKYIRAAESYFKKFKGFRFRFHSVNKQASLLCKWDI